MLAARNGCQPTVGGVPSYEAAQAPSEAARLRLKCFGELVAQSPSAAVGPFGDKTAQTPGYDGFAIMARRIQFIIVVAFGVPRSSRTTGLLDM